MKLRLALIVLTMLSVSGCAISGPAISSGCGWTRYIYMDSADRLTKRTEDAIIKHNETRELRCARKQWWDIIT